MAKWQNAPYGLVPFQSTVGGAWTIKTNTYRITTTTDETGTTGYSRNLFTGDPIVRGTSISGAPGFGAIGDIQVYNPNFVADVPSTFAGVGAAPLLGVFAGCEYTSIDASVNNIIRRPYYPASQQVVPGSEIKAFIADDPSTIFKIKVSTNINAEAFPTFNFVATPYLPNLNPAAGLTRAGSFGANFALMIGGGTNFNVVRNAYNNLTGIAYANNPTSGSVRTGLSGFYLCADTSSVADYNTSDYVKTTTTLPLRAVGYVNNPDNVAAPGLTLETTPFLEVLVTINNHVYAQGSASTVYIA